MFDTLHRLRRNQVRDIKKKSPGDKSYGCPYCNRPFKVGRKQDAQYHLYGTPPTTRRYNTLACSIACRNQQLTPAARDHRNLWKFQQILNTSSLTLTHQRFQRIASPNQPRKMRNPMRSTLLKTFLTQATKVQAQSTEPHAEIDLSK